MQAFQFPPVRLAQIRCPIKPQTSCCARYQVDRTSKHEAGRCDLPARRATFAIAVATEKLLQCIVRAWQVGHVVAVEQARPVTARDLQEMVDRRSQPASKASISLHHTENAGHTAANLPAGQTVLVRQNSGQPVHSVTGHPNRGPVAGRFRPSLVQNRLHLLQRFRKPLFSAIRPRLAEIAVNRSSSFRPGANSGARPSSVMALRTPLQYSKVTSDSVSTQSSTLRSIG